MNIFVSLQRLHTTLFIVTNPSLVVVVFAACMLAYRYLQNLDEVVCSRDGHQVVAIPSQKALLMCPYVYSGSDNNQCSQCVVLASFGIDCSLHLIAALAVWFLQSIYQNDPLYCRHFSLCGSREHRRACRSNTSLRTLCFFLLYHEVCCPYATCRVIDDIVWLSPSSQTHFQEFSVNDPSVLLQNLDILAERPFHKKGCRVPAKFGSCEWEPRWCQKFEAMQWPAYQSK